LSGLLSIAKSGLDSSKKAIQTTGHNIANANTDGYSRQRVDQTTGTPIRNSGLIMGTGSRVRGVNRVEENTLEKRLEGAISENEYFKERLLQLEQTQEIFNEIENDGLNKVLNNFFNSFRQLSSQPENETLRSIVRDNAKLVCNDFNRIKESLNAISHGIDNKISAEVVDINLTIEHLANINKKIAILESNNEEVGDLRDQRDEGVRKLSENFKIHTFFDNRGNFAINADGVGTLVSAGQFIKLQANKQSKSKSGNNMAGSVELFLEGRPSTAISKKFHQGKINALFKVRNADVKEFQDKIDLIAYTFAKSVNAIHKKGYANKNIHMDINNNPIEKSDQGPISNINFFKEVNSIDDAANNITLSREIKSDLRNIVTALGPNGPGDNRVSLAISKLQHEKLMNNRTATIEEIFLQSIGKVGLSAGKARLESEQSYGLIAQTKALKERITGVSLDEEAANLIKYQHAYAASAKVMKTAEEMFQTLLGIKR